MGRADDDRQDDQAEDVVDHRGPHDGLGDGFSHEPEIEQDRRRNRGTRGRERRPDEQGHRELRAVVTHPVDGRDQEIRGDETDQEREHDAAGRHEHVLPRVDQPKIALEADQEQEEDRPEARKGRDQGGVKQDHSEVEPEDARSQDDAERDLAHDRGLMESLDGEVAQRREDEEDRQLEKNRLGARHRRRKRASALKLLRGGPHDSRRALGSTAAHLVLGHNHAEMEDAIIGVGVGVVPDAAAFREDLVELDPHGLPK